MDKKRDDISVLKHQSRVVFDDEGFIMGLVRRSVLRGLGIEEEEMRDKLRGLGYIS